VRSARYAAVPRGAKSSTAEKVAIVFQIEIIEVEVVQIPGVERRPQPGNAMAEIGGRTFETSQLGEQLAKASLSQRLESGDRVSQCDEVALELVQIATSLPDRDQMPLVLLLGGWQSADQFGSPIPAARRLLHPIPLNPQRKAIETTDERPESNHQPYHLDALFRCL
jgi:hypothetical protein